MAEHVLKRFPSSELVNSWGFEKLMSKNLCKNKRE
jgi:hypothetical protein